jgi:hypothetical protein
MKLNKITRGVHLALLGIVASRDFGGAASGEQLEVGLEVSRSMRVQITAGADGARSYAAALSSEAPCEQWFGTEILLHTPEAVNLERAQANGLPLLWDHDTNQPIGRAKPVYLDGNVLRAGDLYWSERGLAQDTRKDVDAGLLGDISIRYTIDDYDEVIGPGGGYTVIVKRWTPLEASIVPIPADFKVGVGRSRELEARRNRGGGTGDDGAIDMAAFKAARLQATSEGATRGAADERSRITEIREIFAASRFKGPEYDALCDYAIAKGSTAAQASRALLELINTETGMGDGPKVDTRVDDDQRRSADARVSAGRSQSEKFVEGAGRALAYRSGLLHVDLLDAEGRVEHAKARELRREMQANDWAGLTMRELAREYLRLQGLRTGGLSQNDIVKFALAPWQHPEGRRDFLAGQGVSDFAALMENNINKAMTVGWTEANETWPLIVREGILNDYKAGTRVNLGAMGSLALIEENGEYKYVKVTDVKEPIQIGKRGALLAITREAIINDDQDAFAKIPRMAGNAAARAVGDSVYALLTANAALTQDSIVLFHASAVGSGGHGNIGSAGAPSVARLDEADKLMAVQKSPGNNESGGLNTELARVIVPRALKTTARVLQTSQYDPAGAAGTLKPNPFANNFVTVSDARLDATSATVWYASGDPNITDTIEVAFLDGNREPFLETRDGWTIDGTEFKIRHEYAAAVLDYRSLVRMPG